MVTVGAMSTGGGLVMLVVVAHPDDETFLSGSLLALAAERGVRTVVACARVQMHASGASCRGRAGSR